MKIDKVNTFLVGNTPPYWGGRCWMFLKLFTDDGIDGVGEWSPTSGREHMQVQLIKDLVNNFLVGANPFEIEKLWHRIYASAHSARHPGLASTPALGAIEMACWDIVGKALKQPIYNLLGGKYNEKLRTYSSMPHFQEAKEGGQIAVNMLKQGYTALKFDPFPPIFPSPRDIPLKVVNQAEKVLKSIRDAIGDEMEICIGTHGQFTTYSAIRIAKMLEKYNPLWFEEPVPPENIDEMARVARATSIPIATGERLVTKYEFVEVLEKQAAQIIQLDVGHCGGILESKKIAGMAEAHYAVIAPHMYCGPVAAAAAIQLDTCSPNFLVQEGVGKWSGLYEEILKNPIKWEKGYIIPPNDPGLGVELNEDIIVEYCPK